MSALVPAQPRPYAAPEPTVTRVDRLLGAISPAWALARVRDRYRLELSQYRAAEINRLRSDWISFGDQTTTPSTSELSLLRNRSRDATRNDPVAAGALETMKVNVVGNGLQPQSRIRADALGISEERARALQRQAEDAWELFKPYADAAEILDFDEIQFLAMARVIEDGEAWLIPTWAESAWRPYGRCLQIIESDRVTSPLVNSGQPSGAAKPDIQDGIEYGPRGQPLAYYVRKSINKARTSVSDHLRIPARDAAGRPKILHVFPSRRAGQARGVPLFAPALTYFKDLADYLEAEVVGARVAACLAVFITKQDAMFSAQNMGSSTETGTGARIQGIEPGMVSYLSPGEAINTVDPRRPGDSFGMFLENVIRIIGNSLGLPYELIAKDFSKTNYSSARASLLEGRRHFMNWRKWLARKVCQPVWELVLEEAYLRGRFDAKDFYRNRHEYCRAMWIGGGWGWVDPVKEVDASRKAVDYGLSNLAEECAAQGRDWEENLVQLAREQAAAKELGVEIYGSTEKPAAAPAKEIDPDDPAALDVAAFEGLKQEADAYGVCVRAGAITPQLDDEEHFRSKAGLPGVSDVIRKAWTDDEGVRRPITLKYKDDEAPAQPAEDDDAKAE